MKRLYLLIYTLLGSGLLIFSMCGKSEPGGIYGFVTDQQSGQPITGVEVILDPPAFKTLTDESGYYTLLDIEKKEYVLLYTYSGYDTAEVEATEMKKGEMYQIDVALVPQLLK
jgi:hypothetical protein